VPIFSTLACSRLDDREQWAPCRIWWCLHDKSTWNSTCPKLEFTSSLGKIT
jgi:hypothetical protein